MQTSGYGNDGLIILVPVGALVVVGVIVFGGPANALKAINDIARDIADEAMRIVSAWL